ncbi:caspase, EACC1-associated type [Nocardia vinacea]|uniref:caspase, EACC1-associated type n=1 Tax=Nocardia vinacea TaxID=96468 RepID=UPI0009FC4F47|nr:caspase family protein [Nocardia vinacea]
MLIGAGRYVHSEKLPEIPAVTANLTDLQRVLTEPGFGAFSTEQCVVVREPHYGAQIGDAIGHAARRATDVLFVYYAGHGLIDRRGRLHLGLTISDPDQVGWSTLSFETLREEILESPAENRILILDCCFSGRAFEGMSGTAGAIAGQVEIRGTYTITSSAANETSFAPAGNKYTAFTEALLSAAAAPGLTLDELYSAADRHLNMRGRPRPRRRSIDATGNLILFGGPRDTATGAARPSRSNPVTPSVSQQPSVASTAVNQREPEHDSDIARTLVAGEVVEQPKPAPENDQPSTDASQLQARGIDSRPDRYAPAAATSLRPRGKSISTRSRRPRARPSDTPGAPPEAVALPDSGEALDDRQRRGVSKWPKRRVTLLGFLVALVIVGGAVYWTYFDRDSRPWPTIAIPSKAYGMAIDPTTRTIYTANHDAGNISVIDANSNSVKRTIDVGAWKNPNRYELDGGPIDIVVDSSAHLLYVGNGPQIQVVDSEADKVIRTIDISHWAHKLAIDESRKRLYAIQEGSDRISEIDATTGIATATISVPNVMSIAFDSGIGTLYAVSWKQPNGKEEGSVSAVDVDTRLVKATIPVGIYPKDIAVDTKLSAAYLADPYASESGEVKVINKADNKIASAISVSKPRDLEIDPATGRLYVEHSGGFAVVDTATQTVVESFSHDCATFGFVVDPVSHTIYTADDRYQTVSIIGRST